MSNMRLVINQKNIGNLYLKSRDIDSILMSLGHDVAKRYGGNASVKLITGIGKRHRVYVNAEYSGASKGNKLLKAVK